MCLIGYFLVCDKLQLTVASQLANYGSHLPSKPGMELMICNWFAVPAWRVVENQFSYMDIPVIANNDLKQIKWHMRGKKEDEEDHVSTGLVPVLLRHGLALQMTSLFLHT